MGMRLPKAPGIVLCAGGLFTLFVPMAAADELHYRDVMIGGRAAGMAGAYTAISDDPSGLYHNPAGIIHAGGTNLSASVNAWHRTRTTYEDVLRGGDWKRESETLIPNFFGTTQPVGPGVLGFSFVVTDAIREDQDQTFTNLNGIDNFTINLDDSQTTFKLGPSYGYSITPRLSVGASLYYHSREQEHTNNSLIVFEQGGGGTAQDIEWRTVHLQNEESGYELVLGLMYDLTERLALGASVRQTNVSNADNYAQVICNGSSQSTEVLCPDGEIDFVQQSDSRRRDHPMEFRLGMAWFYSPSFLISADLSYHTAVHDQVRGRDLEETWNVALGGEYYLSNRWALRGGLYTNNANTPSNVEAHDHVDLNGLSFSVVRFSRNSSVSLGLTHASGHGKGQVFSPDIDPQNMRVNNTTLFLSSSYSF